MKGMLDTAQLPDTRACAVARAVFDVVHPDTVILFGSRARGDFTPDSDIDLLIVTGARRVDPREYRLTSAAARRKATEVYGNGVNVDLVHMTGSDFDYCRRARNHVAGQAARDGLDMNGEKVSYDNPEPTNWPDIHQRIANAERELRVLNALVVGNLDHEAIGFHAQQALENALKGWISALDSEYRNTHDLADLATIVRGHPEEDDTPAGEQLTWLTSYAVRYRYHGSKISIDDPGELLSMVTETVEAIIARIRTLTRPEVQPPR